MSDKGDSRARAKAIKRNEIADRRRRVAALALARMTIAEIVEALSKEGVLITFSTIQRDLVAIRADWRNEQRVKIDRAQEHELAALARDESRLRGHMAGLGPKDHLERCAYQDRILKVMAHRAKILGTEAPQKVDQKVEHVGPLRIEYQNDWKPAALVEDEAATKTVILDAITPELIEPSLFGENGNGNGHG